MLRRTLVTALAAVLTVGTGYAQQAPAASRQQEKPAPKPPAPEGLRTNINIDLTISDQTGPGEPAKRSVSMLVADRRSGSVRSSGQVATTSRSIILNVDAVPTILKDGVIQLDLTLQYAPRPIGENAGREGLVELNQRLSVLVDSGKPKVVSQASDPTSDRKISVEVTATVAK